MAPRRPLATGLAACLWALAGAPAAGQHGGLAVPAERPLHARLADADAVAIARVEAVWPGRLHVAEAHALVGALPDAFPIKRAPSRPPPLGAGDRALLLLRGARPPYVLVERADEIRTLSDAAAEARWSAAVQAVASALATPCDLPRLYARWLRGDDDALRAAAVAGLADPEPPCPSGADAARALAETSVDASATPELRRDAAVAALRTAEGRAALAAACVASPHVDAGVLLVALRGAARLSDPEARPLLERALGHPDRAVRRAAARRAEAAGSSRASDGAGP